MDGAVANFPLVTKGGAKCGMKGCWMVVSTLKTCKDTGGRWGGEGRRGRLLLRPLLQKVRGGLAVRLLLDGSLCTVVRVVVEVLTVGQRPLSGHLVEGLDRVVPVWLPADE